MRNFKKMKTVRKIKWKRKHSNIVERKLTGSRVDSIKLRKFSVILKVSQKKLPKVKHRNKVE